MVPDSRHLAAVPFVVRMRFGRIIRATPIPESKMRAPAVARRGPES